MRTSESFMHQVPTPLPDEHAVSIIYRWFQMTRFETLESFIQVNGCSSKLNSPRRLWCPLYSELAHALLSKYSLADFISKFTNIHDYSLFLDESAFQGLSIETILKKLSTFKFSNALNVLQDKYWRYCPECANEDEQKYGTTYLHVEHQCLYKRVCNKHSVLLEELASCHVSLPPSNNLSILASQSDIEKDVALLGWVSELTDTPPEERKLRVLNLLRQKACVYSYDRKNPYQVQRVQYMQNILAKRFNSSVYKRYFDWGKLTSGHYPLNSSGGLMHFLEPEKHFHPMFYLMLIDLFLTRDEFNLSLEFLLNTSNIRREIPPVVLPLDIRELVKASAA